MTLPILSCGKPSIESNASAAMRAFQQVRSGRPGSHITEIFIPS